MTHSGGRRRREYRETPEFAQFVRRVMRAYARRAEVGPFDPADLAELVELSRELDDAVLAAVKALRSGGFSWSEIGVGLGVTKQAAFDRFASRIT